MYLISMSAILGKRNARIAGSILFACLLVVGCAGGPEATVSYDAEQNRTVYETRPSTVARGGSGSYGSSKSIDMQAVARCKGANCKPDTVELVFSASGSEALSLSGTGGVIEADGVVVNWTSAEASRGIPESPSNTEMFRATGDFAVVPVSLEQVREITQASSVRGKIGGMRLQFGTGEKSKLRALLRKIEQQSDGRTTASSEQ